MAKKPVQQQLTREEYRRALLIERRRTMRTVRNTLIGIAVIAAVWFVLLLAKDKTARENSAPVPPSSPAGTAPAESVPETEFPAPETAGVSEE